MDKDLYYLLAIIMSSVSALLAFINTNLLLRERNAGLRLHLFIKEGQGVEKIYLDASEKKFDRPPEAYRMAIMVENLSSVPTIAISVSLQVKRSPYMPFSGWQSLELIGEFVADSSPPRIDARDYVVYEASAKNLKVRLRHRIVVKTTAGTNYVSVPSHYLDVFLK